ncbi:hypothetical protein [Cellulomonas palmilytica]|uniref:hypothetical protein n=1 Tax=Cellulomonas palmilytica TaxID=2608402 RepID=UPI001F203BCA|nr:hypothetical protein [Cellulomonas palmilytica]UJP40343.1 hypothetical protein F1D97_02065 [Cellulomonas palmilytica]
MTSAITEPVAGLTLFPRPEDVFVLDQADLARYIHPLVTVDLSLVDPSWAGQVHLVSPVEPYEGLVGEDDEHWTDLVRENVIAFRVEGDGRYRFLADTAYFRLAALEADPAVTGFPDRGAPSRDELREYHRARTRHEELTELRAHYDEQRATYEQARAHFAEHGALCMVPLREPHEHYPVPVLDQLGGEAPEGNWVVPDGITVEEHETEDGTVAWPVDPQGRRFHHVASVAGYHYRRSGADSVLLFFEPESRTALLTFDWT